MGINPELLHILYQTGLPSRNPLEEFTPDQETTGRVNGDTNSSWKNSNTRASKL